jgi:hypothetical protein
VGVVVAGSGVWLLGPLGLVLGGLELRRWGVGVPGLCWARVACRDVPPRSEKLRRGVMPVYTRTQTEGDFLVTHRDDLEGGVVRVRLWKLGEGRGT